MKDRTLWKEKIRKELITDELDSVLCTEKWEQAVLKEARPDWVDPDDDEAFFGKHTDVDPNAKAAQGKKKK